MSLSGKEQGFTLVEVLVALLIFMTASLGLLPLLVTNLKVNQGNALHGEARRLVGETMTRLQVAEYSSLPATIDDPLYLGLFELQQEISPDTPSEGQTLITVTARWPQRGQRCEYRLQSIRSEP